MIAHVVAYGQQREIGKDNALLWRLPDDLKHFKKLTTGQTVLMGRKTFQSIGRPLPNRHNIVVTADHSFEAEGVDVWHDLTALESYAKETDVFVIGGATLYEQTMSRASHFFITEVDGSFEADTFYPTLPAQVMLQERSTHEPDEHHAFRFHFLHYIKTDNA